MKRASEVLKEIMPDTTQRLDDFTSFWVEQAMIAYAEQAIQICAEDAEVKYKENAYGCFEIVGISEKSILNVKKLLK
jgi:hypothetical protein